MTELEFSVGSNVPNSVSLAPSPHTAVQSPSSNLHSQGPVNSYVVERLLGSSEMTCVFVGAPFEDKPNFQYGVTENQVCVKELQWKKMNRSQRMAAVFEAKLLAEAQHPSIVQFFNCGFRTPLSEVPPIENMPPAISSSDEDMISYAAGCGDEPEIIFMRALDRSFLLSLDEGPILEDFVSHEYTGYFYIVMELCQGGDISQCTWAKRALNAESGHVVDVENSTAPPECYFEEDMILQWIVQVVLALGFLHCRPHPVLHRDLKAANVFILGESDFRVKLGDFGISRQVIVGKGGSGAALAKTVIGTPLYLSPELCAGKAYGIKADMWALGCFLFEACALHPPFRGSSNREVIRLISAGAFAPFPKHAYSEDTLRLVSSLLRLDPNDRPHVGEVLQMPLMQDAFLSFLEEEPLTPDEAEKLRSEYERICAFDLSVQERLDLSFRGTTKPRPANLDVPSDGDLFIVRKDVEGNETVTNKDQQNLGLESVILTTDTIANHDRTCTFPPYVDTNMTLEEMANLEGLDELEGEVMEITEDKKGREEKAQNRGTITTIETPTVLGISVGLQTQQEISRIFQREREFEFNQDLNTSMGTGMGNDMGVDRSSKPSFEAFNANHNHLSEPMESFSHHSSIHSISKVPSVVSSNTHSQVATPTPTPAFHHCIQRQADSYGISSDFQHQNGEYIESFEQPGMMRGEQYSYNPMSVMPYDNGDDGSSSGLHSHFYSHSTSNALEHDHNNATRFGESVPPYSPVPKHQSSATIVASSTSRVGSRLSAPTSASAARRNANLNTNTSSTPSSSPLVGIISSPRVSKTPNSGNIGVRSKNPSSTSSFSLTPSSSSSSGCVNRKESGSIATKRTNPPFQTNLKVMSGSSVPSIERSPAKNLALTQNINELMKLDREMNARVKQPQPANRGAVASVSSPSQQLSSMRPSNITSIPRNGSDVKGPQKSNNPASTQPRSMQQQHLRQYQQQPQQYQPHHYSAPFSQLPHGPRGMESSNEIYNEVSGYQYNNQNAATLNSSEYPGKQYDYNGNNSFDYANETNQDNFITQRDRQGDRQQLLRKEEICNVNGYGNESSINISYNSQNSRHDGHSRMEPRYDSRQCNTPSQISQIPMTQLSSRGGTNTVPSSVRRDPLVSGQSGLGFGRGIGSPGIMGTPKRSQTGTTKPRVSGTVSTPSRQARLAEQRAGQLPAEDAFSSEQEQVAALEASWLGSQQKREPRQPASKSGIRIGSAADLARKAALGSVTPKTPVGRGAVIRPVPERMARPSNGRNEKVMSSVGKNISTSLRSQIPGPSPVRSQNIQSRPHPPHPRVQLQSQPQSYIQRQGTEHGQRLAQPPTQDILRSPRDQHEQRNQLNQQPNLLYSQHHFQRELYDPCDISINSRPQQSYESYENQRYSDYYSQFPTQSSQHQLMPQLPSHLQEYPHFQSSLYPNISPPETLQAQEPLKRTFLKAGSSYNRIFGRNISQDIPRLDVGLPEDKQRRGSTPTVSAVPKPTKLAKSTKPTRPSIKDLMRRAKETASATSLQNDGFTIYVKENGAKSSQFYGASTEQLNEEQIELLRLHDQQKAAERAERENMRAERLADLRRLRLEASRKKKEMEKVQEGNTSHGNTDSCFDKPTPEVSVLISLPKSVKLNSYSSDDTIDAEISEKTIEKTVMTEIAL